MSQRHLHFKGSKTPTQLLKAEPQLLSKAGCGCFQIFSLPAKNPFSCSFPWLTHPLQEHPTSINARRQRVDFTAILPQSPARESSPGKPPDPPGCTSLAHQPCITLPLLAAEILLGVSTSLAMSPGQGERRRAVRVMLLRAPIKAGGKFCSR